MTKPVFFLIVLSLSLSVRAQGPDISILRHINSQEALPSDDFFRFVNSSDYYFVAGLPVVLGVTGMITGDDDMLSASLTAAGACVINLGLTTVLKYGINRDRPFDTYPDIYKKTSAGSPSFPSGHTAFAFSSATSISLEYPEWYIIIPSFLWAGSVAYSGMHLGVHYPADVLAGALTGAFSAWLSYRITGLLRRESGKF